MSQLGISQRMLETIVLREKLAQSELFKAAAAVSDAAMVIGNETPQAGPQPGPAAEVPLSEELLARAENPELAPEDQQAFAEAADRMKVVDRPSEAAAAQPPPEMQAAPPQAPGEPEAAPPPGAAPPPKMAAAAPKRSDDFGRVVSDRQKQAEILSTTEERPNSMSGFREWLSSFS